MPTRRIEYVQYRSQGWAYFWVAVLTLAFATLLAHAVVWVILGAAIGYGLRELQWRKWYRTNCTRRRTDKPLE